MYKLFMQQKIIKNYYHMFKYRSYFVVIIIVNRYFYYIRLINTKKQAI